MRCPNIVSHHAVGNCLSCSGLCVTFLYIGQELQVINPEPCIHTNGEWKYYFIIYIVIVTQEAQSWATTKHPQREYLHDQMSVAQRPPWEIVRISSTVSTVAETQNIYNCWYLGLSLKLLLYAAFCCNSNMHMVKDMSCSALFWSPMDLLLLPSALPPFLSTCNKSAEVFWRCLNGEMEISLGPSTVKRNMVVRCS